MFRFSTIKAAGRPVYLVAGKRTPIGSFLQSLHKFSAPELSAFATKALLEETKLQPNDIDQVILGNVVSAGIGQAPARIAALKAGLPESVPCTTINKVCSSGMKAVMLAAQSVALGQSQITLAGGFQSMSNIPFYVMKHRKGQPFGDQKLLDGLATDGLVDAYCGHPMGLVAEKTAAQLKLTREVLDAYTIGSYQRLIKAEQDGLLKDEIAVVKTETGDFSADQEVKNFKKDKISKLRPAFSQTGVNTAGNSSKLSDGACSLLVASEEAVKKKGLKPMARILAYADAEISPNDFCIAPSSSIKKALGMAGLTVGQVDYFQINQAFAVAALANMKLLDIPLDKINIWGGAIALGHPIGMSGARILLTLSRVLASKSKKIGVAAICNGGGGSSAVVIERL